MIDFSLNSRGTFTIYVRGGTFGAQVLTERPSVPLYCRSILSCDFRKHLNKTGWAFFYLAMWKFASGAGTVTTDLASGGRDAAWLEVHTIVLSVQLIMSPASQSSLLAAAPVSLLRILQPPSQRCRTAGGCGHSAWWRPCGMTWWAEHGTDATNIQSGMNIDQCVSQFSNTHKKGKKQV